MGGRGDRGEGRAAECAWPSRSPACPQPLGWLISSGRLAEQLCPRRRLLSAASSVLCNHGGTCVRARACVRARSLRGAPILGVPGRVKETEAGARKDTAPGQSRPPRVKSEAPAQP